MLKLTVKFVYKINPMILEKVGFPITFFCTLVKTANIYRKIPIESNSRIFCTFAGDKILSNGKKK